MFTPNNTYHCSEETYFRLANHSLEHALEQNRITTTDRKLIEKYALRLKSKISPGRYNKIVSMLVNVRRYFDVEFSQVDEDAYLIALSNIKYAKHTCGKHKGEPYSKNTIVDWMKITKRFFLFLVEQNLTTVPKKTIQETEVGVYDIHTKTDADVLTAEEIDQLISAAKSLKFKAYIGLLYETGARSIEMANLRWKDITVQTWGIQCTLHDTKTDKIRTVPCVMYAQYVHLWRNQYPGDASGDNFVFVTRYNKPIQYRGVLKEIDRCREAAGITKRITLHIFRHSRITHVLREGMSETLVKKAFWGNAKTNMIETYGHLTSDDIRIQYMKMAGVTVDEEKPDISPKPITCSRCHKILPPGTSYCPDCGMALTEAAAEKVNDAVKIVDDVLLKLPQDVRMLIAQKLNLL
ncbi:MAG TPA: tyrosine-type recombinase/integrase [Methanocorpusculum sp.]|nr:tyrosine-type recombinase/integrase [Methanocorpusculum sp.]HJJ39982.1 tyrosine-type recombinase/integrase [Methanocorpusculum sp.]HJJ49465.1 tyrosine-type recombinase/integrase [Methanocorpusculum sp.]HJJ57017.1 tyrosine-type recombinase/integrase [Methanocorpusculum sp.]